MANVLQINTLDSYTYNLVRDALLDNNYLQLSAGLSDLMTLLQTQGRAFCQ